MRGASLIGIAVVLLIIGVLVMKNMNADSTSGTHKTKPEAHMEKARVAAEDVDKRSIDIRKSVD
jgi:hypothetical protein